MKELSIEQKAKRYDEAIAHVKLLLKTIGNATLGNLVLKNEFENMFPELKESGDESIGKEIVNFINHRKAMGSITPEESKRTGSWIAWLEKQGEQKPTDKIEPKFKVGDWVIDKQDIVHQIANVENVTSHNYGYYTVDGKYFNDCVSGVRLWTIQDAKDGDVLVEDSCIFIIQKLSDNITAAKTYCTLYDDGDFDDGALLYFDIDSTKPATKEQRDTLMKAIVDAGYKWDGINKKLKRSKKLRRNKNK